MSNPKTFKLKVRVKRFMGSISRASILEKSFCCESMAEAFGEFIYADAGSCGEVSIANCHPYPEGAVFDYEKINFCPFCGGAIENQIEAFSPVRKAN